MDYSGLYQFMITAQAVKTALEKYGFWFGGVDYNLHQPQTIPPIPPSDLEEAWQVDYRTMQEQMIYGDSPTYKDLIQGIQGFLEKMNALDWKMKMESSPPKK